MKALKVIGVIITLSLVLVIALALLLPKLIDPNDYREQLEQAALEHTGLKVELAGPISWSVFPWLGLALNDLNVSDKQQRPLAQLQQANIGVKLLPLLSRRLEMNTLRLSGLHLNLIRDKKGHGNWELAADDATRSVVKETKETTPAPTETAESSTLNLNIAAVQIDDLKIDYQDLSSGQKLLLGPAQLSTGAISLDTPFTLTAQLPLQSQQPALAATVDINTQILLKQNGFRLDQLSFKVRPQGGDSELKLSGFVQQVDSQREMQLAVAPVNLKQLLDDFGLEVPQTEDPDALTQVSLLLRAQGGQQQMQINPLTLELDGFNLKGEIDLSNLDQTAKVRFKLNGDTLNIDRYLAPAQPPAETASTDSPAAESTPAKASQSPQNAELFPAETRKALQALDIAGSLKLEHLTIAQLPLEKPHLDISAQGGKLQINTLEAGLFDGRIQHESLLDLRKKPALSSQTQLTSVQVQPLVKALAGMDQLSGALNTDAQLSSRFDTQEQLLANLNGQFNFKLIEGQLQGVNLNKLVCSAIAGVRKESMSKSDWPAATDFNSVKGSWKIKQGVARNQDLTAALDQLSLTGAGLFNIPRKEVDYRAKLTLLGATAAEDEPACKINPKYADVRWPVHCKGALGSEGLCGIDSEALVEEVAKLYGDEVKQKLNEKLQEKLGTEGGALLKGLFN